MTTKSQPRTLLKRSGRANPPSAENPVRLTASTTNASPARLVIALVLGAALSWLVLGNSLLAYLSDAEPDFVVSAGAATARALTVLADRSVGRKIDATRKDDTAAKVAPDAGLAAPDSVLSDDDIKAYAKRALAADPFNARAIRILGQAAILNGDKVEASRLMTAALQRDVHEYRAAAWLLQDSYERSDKPGMAKYAQTLLMTNSITRPYVVQVLAKLAEDPAGRKELVGLLADDPRWRGMVLGMLPARTPDARSVFLVLQDLKDTPNPPTSQDVSTYLTFLMTNKLYDFAYYVWLQFLPPEQLESLGLLNNGTFETPLAGGPFDWTLAQGSGSTVKIENTQNPDGHALYVEFGLGRVNFGGVKQTLMLGPGAYKLSGAYKGEMRAVRGLEWRIACLAKPAAVLSATEMFTRAAPGWTPFELTFTVPAEGCVGQSLSLVLNARLQSERILSGSLWFDDLAIAAVPVEAAATQPTP